MGYPVTLIREEGIGSEIIAATQTAIDATGITIDWRIVDTGIDTMNACGTPLPDYVIDSIRETKTILKGPVSNPVDQDAQFVSVQMCRQLNLYANLRPVKLMAGVKSCFRNIDWVIVQENTEGFFAGIEFERTTVEAAEARSFLSKLTGKRIREDSALGIKTISVKGCGQIAELAFNYAQVNDRQKVTAVHMARRMGHTDGLFLEIVRAVAKDYPDIEFEDRAVDTLCMQLMQQPECFDVLVMPNLYGDILSSLCAGMTGGLGVAPIAHIGDEYAVFESVCRSESQYAGLHPANPTALILSGVLMLQHLGEKEAAQKLQAAVEKVIATKANVTYDIVPTETESVGTLEMAEAIAQAITE